MELYIKKKYNIIQKIAKLIGVPWPIVVKLMDKYNIPRRKRKIEIPEEELEKLVREGYSPEQIAQKYGCNKITILKILHKYGLSPRAKYTYGKIPSREELEYLYWKQGMTAKRIAKKLGYSKAKILRCTRKYGIPRRPPLVKPKKKVHITKETLWKLYIEQQLSMEKIAEILGCSKDTVKRRLIEYEIPIRKRKNTRGETSRRSTGRSKSIHARISKLRRTCTQTMEQNRARHNL